MAFIVIQARQLPMNQLKPINHNSLCLFARILTWQENLYVQKLAAQLSILLSQGCLVTEKIDKQF